MEAKIKLFLFVVALLAPAIINLLPKETIGAAISLMITTGSLTTLAIIILSSSHLVSTGGRIEGGERCPFRLTGIPSLSKGRRSYYTLRGLSLFYTQHVAPTHWSTVTT